MSPEQARAQGIGRTHRSVFLWRRALRGGYWALPFRGKARGSSSKPFSTALRRRRAAESRRATETGRHYQQGPGERPQSALSERGRNAGRPATAEARYGADTVRSKLRDGGGRNSSGHPAAHTSSSSAGVAAARQHKLGLGVSSMIAILLVAAAAYGIMRSFCALARFRFKILSSRKLPTPARQG